MLDSGEWNDDDDDDPRRTSSERTNERTNHHRREENPHETSRRRPPRRRPDERAASVPRIAAVVQSMTHHLSIRRGRYPSDDQPPTRVCMYVPVYIVNNKWFDIRSTNGLKHIQVGSSHSRTFVPPAA